MRAKPSRKTKSKGNHLKNLQNRIDIKNEYEQVHVPIPETPTTATISTSTASIQLQQQQQYQNLLVSELTNHRKFEKSTVS